MNGSRTEAKGSPVFAAVLALAVGAVVVTSARSGPPSASLRKFEAIDTFAFDAQGMHVRVTARPDRVELVDATTGAREAFRLFARVGDDESPVTFSGPPTSGPREAVSIEGVIEHDASEWPVEVMIGAAGDGVISVALVVRDTRASDHDVHLGVELLSTHRGAFVSGAGELADGGRSTGSAALLTGEIATHAFFARSSNLVVDTLPSLAKPGFTGMKVVAPARSCDSSGVSCSALLYASDRVETRLYGRVFAAQARPTFAARGHAFLPGRGWVVCVTPGGEPLVRFPVDEDGGFAVDVPVSCTTFYAITSDGRQSTSTAHSPDAQDDIRLMAEHPGELAVALIDPDTRAPITGRVIVRGEGGTVDPTFGPDYRASGAGPVADALSGSVVTPLPPGTYRVLGTKGLEWSIDEARVVVESGRRVSVTLQPRHVVATPDWVGCDLHVHSMPSFDTPVTVEDRVISLVAAGVDFAAATEHNVVGDYSEALQVTSLGGELTAVRGVEVTTNGPSLGHFGVFPYPADRAVPPFRNTTLDAIFRTARRRSPRGILQVNHPRITDEIGYFELHHFEPSSDRVPSGMRLDFDALEVWNGYELGSREHFERVLNDYFHLLDLGHRYVATGNSDSHRIQYNWAGYPRTYVNLQGADRARPSSERIVERLRGAHAFVTTGPILDISVDGATPGDELLTRDTRITAHVTVRAAPWVDVSRVEVIASSRVVMALEVPETDLHTGREGGLRAEAEARNVRYNGDISFDVPAADTWVVVRARGKRRLDEILPSVPAVPDAFTNPIWIKRPR